jgi:hypothetical protein
LPWLPNSFFFCRAPQLGIVVASRVLATSYEHQQDSRNEFWEVAGSAQYIPFTRNWCLTLYKGSARDLHARPTATAKKNRKQKNNNNRQ